MKRNAMSKERAKIYSYDDIFFSNFEEFFKDYKFADGTPFGVKIEEDK